MILVGIVLYVLMGLAAAIAAHGIDVGAKGYKETVACLFVGLTWPFAILVRLWGLFFRMGMKP